MAHFLFQPGSIDGMAFKPIRIDIHLGVVKIETDGISCDFDINNFNAIMVGTSRGEVIARIQLALSREYERYGKMEEEDIPLPNYDDRQQWKRIQRLFAGK
jgi:hypothetical protein